MRLLVSAADQLAWASPSPDGATGLAECLDEAADHEHLQLRCADAFDRLEYLEGIASGWHALMERGNVPADLLELLCRFWTRPFSEIRRDVTALLAAVAAAPATWLTLLDRVNEASPELLSLFGRLLAVYQRATEPDADGREPERLAVLARHFLDEQLGLSYKEMRPQLLAFCLREFIDPELIARLDNQHNDWPLRHVYRACLLFGG